MAEELGAKKLATIMSVDIAGYSALAEVDETEAIAAVGRVRGWLQDAAAREGGRIFSAAGDGFMLEFPSAASALNAADQFCAAAERKAVRVGLHLCDVMLGPSGDLLGHGVNIAVRLQELARPGAIVASIDVRRAVRGKLAQRLHPFGAVNLHHMNETIEVFTLEAVAASRAVMKRGDPVLAVLPFDNASDDAEMEYFSDGVADEIILALMRQSTLKVIGRTSAFQFRGPRKLEAAAVLHASHVLDGAVRRHGEKFRVNAQLIEAENGVALWSSAYDGEVPQAFDLQDDIAAEVGAALRHAFARAARVQTVDPAAYDLYLRARQIWLTLSDVEEEQAEVLLMRCVELAPNFAPGWATLASVRAFLLPRSRDLLGEPMHAAALEAAQTALEIDPDCPQAFAALSLLKPAFAEHAEKIRLVDEALKRAPNDPSLLVARAAWLYGVGRIRDALETLDLAQRLDPLGPVAQAFRASVMSASGDVDEALRIVSAAWARWPDSPFIWYMTWLTLCAAGKLDEADALTMHGAPPKRGVSLKDVRMLKAYVALLRLPESERAAPCEAMLDNLARSTSPLALSSCMVAAASGRAEQAFDVLDKALDEGRALRPDPHDGFGMARSLSSMQLFVQAAGPPFYSHRRFAHLCARLGLAQYWLQSGHWPDCADLVDYDFRAECAAAVAARA